MEWCATQIRWVGNGVDRWADQFLLNAPTHKKKLHFRWKQHIEGANEQGRKLWGICNLFIMLSVPSVWDTILFLLTAVVFPMALFVHSRPNFKRFGWAINYILLTLFYFRSRIRNTQPDRGQVIVPEFTGAFFWLMFLYTWHEVSTSRFSVLLAKHVAVNLISYGCVGLRLSSMSPTFSILMITMFCWRRNLGGDISDKMTALISREKLENSRREAEFLRDVSSSKSVFLRTLCHELRNPMTAVQGNNEILVRKLDGFTARSQREMEPCAKEKLCDELLASLPGMLRFSSNALLSSKHMSDVINQTLTSAKLEADQPEVVPELYEEVCLRECLETMIHMFEVVADKKGLQLRLVLPEGQKDVIIKIHKSCLKQTVINLLGNALKFTHKGSVVVSVRVLGQEGILGTRLQCCVADTGIGMTPDEQAKLFVPFSQANDEIGETYGGSGLGLDIVQQSLKKLGGTIRVESAEKEGSRFIFELPVDIVPKTEPMESQDDEDDRLASGFQRKAQERRRRTSQTSDYGVPLEDFTGVVTPSLPRRSRRRSRCVLVADDDDGVREMLREQLVSVLDCVVTVARNGAEAVERAKEQEFTLIIMDINMPVLNGLDATRAIRWGEADLNRATPIVGFSGNSLQSDFQLGREAGMDSYLAKPHKLAALCEMVEKYTAEPTAAQQEEGSNFVFTSEETGPLMQSQDDQLLAGGPDRQDSPRRTSPNSDYVPLEAGLVEPTAMQAAVSFGDEAGPAGIGSKRANRENRVSPVSAVEVGAEEGSRPETWCLPLDPKSRSSSDDSDHDGAFLPSEPQSVLVVDDDEPVRVTLVSMLELFSPGLVIRQAADHRTAVAESAKMQFDLIFMDRCIPGCGIQAVRDIRAGVMNAATPIVLVSGLTSDSMVESDRVGISRFMLKPYLMKDIQTVLESHHLDK